VYTIVIRVDTIWKSILITKTGVPAKSVEDQEITEFIDFAASPGIYLFLTPPWEMHKINSSATVAAARF